MIPHDIHLQIGSLLFEGVDQIDLTGPFEVLSRLPNSTYRIYGKSGEPVRDLRGLRLTPDAALADAPQLDVLHVPGGFGQEALMEDADVLGWIAGQAAGARSVLSVCTGALLCGAAGLLKGRRATTHWASFHLLPLFGAIPVNQRVVVDGNWVFAAGVTAGIDGALRLAAELRGEDAAKAIQLYMVYAPEPPFDSGTPETAPAAILAQARRSVAGITAQREVTARRVATTARYRCSRRDSELRRLPTHATGGLWRKTRDIWRFRQSLSSYIACSERRRAGRKARLAMRATTPRPGSDDSPWSAIVPRPASITTTQGIMT